MCELNRINKGLFTAFILMVMVSLVHVARFVKKGMQPAVPKEAIHAKAKGNPSGSIHVVEYSDFQCPACTRASRTLKQYFEKYSSRMYVEFRHYPIPRLHPYAITSAVFSECAAKQGKFWDYHDLLFETNREWSRSLRVRGRLMDMAEGIGMEMESFRRCVVDPSVEIEVLEEKSNGSGLGVHATPSYFINDQMVVGSRSLKEKLETLLGGGRS